MNWLVSGYFTSSTSTNYYSIYFIIFVCVHILISIFFIISLNNRGTYLLTVLVCLHCSITLIVRLPCSCIKVLVITYFLSVWGLLQAAAGRCRPLQPAEQCCSSQTRFFLLTLHQLCVTLKHSWNLHTFAMQHKSSLGLRFFHLLNHKRSTRSSLCLTQTTRISFCSGKDTTIWTHRVPSVLLLAFKCIWIWN